jgi:hypothetical protein
MSTATVPRATGYPVPATGADLNSEPVRTQFVNIVDFLEGGNIATGNVNTSEIATLGTANTWSANQIFSGTIAVTGVATFTAQSVHTGGIQSGGNILSDTNSTDDLGSNAVRWANLYVDDITVTTSVTASGVITGATVEATGDTSAGDNAAMGYTATEGLILTGQGSTNDVTIKNDADAAVISIPTGTTGVTFAGALTATNGGSLTGTWSDLGTVTTVDINGGTVDGVTIGGASAGAGTFTTLTSSSTTDLGATTVDSLSVSDGNITNVGDIALDSITSDGTTITIGTGSTMTFTDNTTIAVSLGNDAGDDFTIDSTAFVVEGDTGNVGIGTSSPSTLFHVTGGGTNHVQIQANGATEVRSNNNSGSVLTVRNDGTADAFTISDAGTDVFTVQDGGNVVIGTGAISTSATDGFLYIPSMAGAPSGTPTDQSNLSALCHDTTNNRLYVYDHVSNAWQYATLT